jgi:hypothetical protein
MRDNHIQRVNDPTTIEDILLDNFQRHFDQATETPFTVAPLKQLLGYGGHNDNTNKPLDGSLHIPGISSEMKSLLQNF